MTKKLPGTKMPVARFFRTNLYPVLGVLNPTKEMESQLSRLQPAGGTLCLPVWHAHQSSRDPEQWKRPSRMPSGALGGETTPRTTLIAREATRGLLQARQVDEDNLFQNQRPGF